MFFNSEEMMLLKLFILLSIIVVDENAWAGGVMCYKLWFSGQDIDYMPFTGVIQFETDSYPCPGT